MICVLCFVIFMEPLLAFENLALNKFAWQSSSYNGLWTADKAVDGRYSIRTALGGQCAISGINQRTATWVVDLWGVVSISHINIHYRTDDLPSPSRYVSRMAGFSLFVSNTTSKDDGHLCFHEIQNVSGTPLEDQRINCSLHGRYVIYYNERDPDVIYPGYYSQYAINELCEVEVYGCSVPGYYGENCNIRCPEHCQGHWCEIHSGACFGCNPGYQSLHCDQVCSGQRYGPECSLSCGSCNDREACHHINGSCLQGCDGGFEGEKCLKECDFGYYGKNCRYSCAENCQFINRCSRLDGACEGGCIPGWAPSRCDQECDFGYYGKNCRYSCAENCQFINRCSRLDGACEGGCIPGWAPSRCDQECDGGMYGVNCSLRCGTCLDSEPCHRINGTCLNGCSPGYFGPRCSEVCEETFWGLDCRERCSNECEGLTCRHDTGECYLLKKTDRDDFLVPVVVGTAACAVVVVIIIVIKIVVVLRRKKSSSNTYEETTDQGDHGINVDLHYSVMTTSTTEHGSSRNIHGDGDSQKCHDTSVYVENITNISLDSQEYNDIALNAENNPDIIIEELEKIIKDNLKDEDNRFKRDYEDLPYGEQNRCEEGKHSANIAKNRRKSLIPYDDTRVKLRNRQGQGDYINASFIPGYLGNEEYIATQGPKQNTVSDFWAMVWQENVSQIVMLTNLQEGTKVKCDQYWPDMQQSLLHDVISVRTTKEKHYATYSIREFMVTNKKLNEKRIVTQYQYIAWTDHELPEPLCLAMFHAHVRRTIDNQTAGPTLVHCSNGVGQTGTYVAIDSLYKAGKQEKKINASEYVKKMRWNRMNMVQTYEQYILIFLTLSERFKADIIVQTKADFLKRAGSMTRDELNEELKKLQNIQPSYTEAEYIRFSRGVSQTSIRPLERYSLHVRLSRCNDAVNAISLPSYVSQKSFIVTQCPTPEDAVFFLHMLTEYKSNTVICMDAQEDLEFSSEWLPHHKSKTLPPFTVHRQRENVTGVKCTTLHIVTNGSNDEVRSVEVVEPKSRTQSTDQLSSTLFSLVTYALDNKPMRPVTVVSRDGAARCGVFCAVHNVLQQLSMDGEVDIFSVVRQLQVRCPELCSTSDEYHLIYTAVLGFIRSQEQEMYANL
ncbi:receptor-type tyrosine-protein phosphatase alpha-like [Ostrea edulis]|uniref:receptor-type tyrosine-protein phosphatase alpha-like n=1 Tax=Ostrea edulis TaxID=37623 RepID=UPI0024AF06BF|nr:receptor-type tyrosine-protein phosphatase alpha-like [Ostrea edulis]